MSVMATIAAPRTVNRRLFLAGGLVAAGIGYLAWSGLEQTMVYYVTVGELLGEGGKAVARPVRVGGRVVDGTLVHDARAGLLSFTMTDGTGELPVVYRGVKPDMLGYSSQNAYQDVVVEGKLGADGVLRATQLIVKHGPDFAPASGQP